jgi:hypothetical protein
MTLFRSFIQGGFECSTLCFPGGRRLDLIETTGHARHAELDYQALGALGIHTVRDAARWHLIEAFPGCYDWSSFLPQLHAASRTETQVIWDLCHYGVPDHIDIWSHSFAEQFASFARAVAVFVRDHCADIPIYCPINEISYWAFAGGEAAHFAPGGFRRGAELKRQLVRACVAASEAIRQVDSRARLLHADPLINVVPAHTLDVTRAESATHSQYHAWDMIGGMAHEDLGGSQGFLDVIGVNFYPHNQWYLDGPGIGVGSPGYKSFRALLADVYDRYRRPVLIAETGAEGDARASWFRYICDETAAAVAQGIPVLGICMYPITHYPGWEDDRPCATGVLGFANDAGHRPLDVVSAGELAFQQLRFEILMSERPAPGDDAATSTCTA